jgi:hypothetical protein
MQLQDEYLGRLLNATKREAVATGDVSFAGSFQFSFERIIVVERDNYVTGLSNFVGECSIGGSSLGADFPEPFPQ